MNALNTYNSPNPISTLPQSLANYEPKQQLPLTLRPVPTPSNNPEAFKALQNQNREAGQAAKNVKSIGLMMPGSE